jgi:hypothetical protein
MDLYFGILSPAEISSCIISELRKKGLFDHNVYYSWLSEEENKYQLLTISDGSVWTLRRGNEPERYVHIHPGRYSAHTVRVKSTTLKTIIFILAYQKIYPDITVDVSIINKLRLEYLNTPPIKSVRKSSGIHKVLNLFNSI